MSKYKPLGHGFTGAFPDITDCSDPKEAFMRTIGEERRATIKNVKVCTSQIQSTLSVITKAPVTEHEADAFWFI